MIKSEFLKKTGTDDYVYDISLDGTFVDAFTGFVCHNTDGFNFELPDDSKYRYTKENPYIGKGSNREVKLGVEYDGFEADVAEFNDLYMKDVHSSKGVQKMGLGIDEVIDSSINFARKNYADYFPDEPYPKDIKLVGNTVKSKKMPEYIAKFLSVAIRMLLRGEGQNFIEYYYEYVEKIYNYKIPLRDIATKGKIKKGINQYLKDVKELTKSGRPKSRQAWYELAIKEGITVNNGDTIYYVNTGKSKSHADVKKVTVYLDSQGSDITKEIEKEYKLYGKENKGNKNKKTKLEWMNDVYPNINIKEEIILNCKLVPRDVIDNDNDVYCSEDLLYNTAKYIDMFNKRITPLLVCFSKEIRTSILVSNPNDRKYFTKEQCELVSGEPNKPGDQDTYEQLMTMEDKEIKFWTKYDLVPPFIEECGMGKWEDIVADYNFRMERDRKLGIDKEKEAIAEIISNMSKSEVEAFMEDGDIPAAILKIADINPETMKFMSKSYPDIELASLTDILEKLENSSFIEGDD